MLARPRLSLRRIIINLDGYHIGSAAPQASKFRPKFRPIKTDRMISREADHPIFPPDPFNDPAGVRCTLSVSPLRRVRASRPSRLLHKSVPPRPCRGLALRLGTRVSHPPFVR